MYNIQTGASRPGVPTQAEADAGWVVGNAPTPVASPTPAPAPILPTTTPADAYAGLLSENPEQKALRLEQERQQAEASAAANQTLDPTAIRKGVLDQFQYEIDAVNQVYAEKKRQAMIIGQGRLGSGAAIQSRRGLIGSTMGETQTTNIEDQNIQVQSAIDSEKQAAVSAVMNKVQNLASAELAQKTATRKAGAEAYLTFLEGAATRKESRVTSAIQTILANGLTPDEAVFKNLADQLGVDVAQFKAAYNSAKSTSDVASAKAAQEAQKPVLELEKLKQATDKKSIETKDMMSKGFSYVSTPAERDNLKKQGYEIVNYGGRTYAKQGKFTQKTVKVGKQTFIITYDSQGNEIKRENLGAGTIKPKQPKNPNQSPDSFDKKQAIQQVNQYFYGLTGIDKKVSPQDYNAAKNSWIADGGNAESFDSQFYKMKNPENPNY